MRSRAKVLGHPLHPMLVVFPLGLLSVALLFDIIGASTGNPAYHTVAFWDIAAGLIGGLLAAVPGFIDWLAIPRNTRARAIGLWHALGNVVVLALFAVAWSLRYDLPDHRAYAAPLTLEVIAVGLALVTGWLGGELVDRLGIGVDEGAHPNAPSSLAQKGPVTQPPF